MEEELMAENVALMGQEPDGYASDGTSSSGNVRHSPVTSLRKQAATSFVVEVGATKGITTARELHSFESAVHQVRALHELHASLAEAANGATSTPAVHGLPDGVPHFPSSFDDLDLLELLQEPSYDPACTGFSWVNVQTANPQHIAQLGQACHLHRLTVEDIASDVFEKAEPFVRRGYLYCMIHAEDTAGSEAHIHVCLFRGWVLTIHNSSSTIIQQVLRRLEDEFSFGGSPTGDSQDRHRCVAHPSWVPYAVADLDIDWMLETARLLVQEAQETDLIVVKASSKEQADVLRRISLARSRIYAQLQRHYSKQRLLMSLCSAANESFVTPHMKTYLRDVFDHIQSCGKRLDFAQEVLGQASNGYVAAIGIEEAQLSNRANILVGRLTMLTLPPTIFNLVGNMFGFNVQVPMQNVSGLGPFCAIVFSGIVFCVTSFLVVTRLDQQQQQQS